MYPPQYPLTPTSSTTYAIDNINKCKFFVGNRVIIKYANLRVELPQTRILVDELVINKIGTITHKYSLTKSTIIPYSCLYGVMFDDKKFAPEVLEHEISIAPINSVSPVSPLIQLIQLHLFH